MKKTPMKKAQILINVKKIKIIRTIRKIYIEV